MIPKTIHYCWFGRGEMSELTKKCIQSWKENLPDYEIKLWNEDNFDVNTNRYVKEAYESKKYAFVSDFLRLYVLYHEGGIYMDTDVEVLKPLDRFLHHSAFTGVENEKYCVTGIMGAESNHPWIKILLDDYKDRRFFLQNGIMDMTTNTERITELTINYFGWSRENRYQELRNQSLAVYPFHTFCAKDCSTGEVHITDQTYTIHHFSGSWLTEEEKRRGRRNAKIKNSITKLIGESAFNVLNKLRKKIFKNS